MPCDELTSYYTDLLDGSYSCLDRLVVNANFAPCYSAGGFRWWWRQLHNGSDEELDDAHLMRMAGHFGRRLRGWAKAHRVPVIDCRLMMIPRLCQARAALLRRGGATQSAFRLS